MFTDYHVHSEFSDDSVYPIEQVVKDAIKMRLEEICFTEHVDYGIKDDWDGGHPIRYRDGEPFANADYPKYVEAVQPLQEKYKNDIKIKLGLEFGIQVHTIPKYEKLFNRYLFDFIILSIHQVENKEFWTQDFQKGRTQKEIHQRYYEEMLNVVKNYKDYSVLGHVDLIARYDNYGDYSFDNIKDILAEIFKIVIADNKGIEFNTSFHRYGLKDTTPSRDILKLYKDLGGKIITIGSDSHKPEHLGRYNYEAQKILKELGFEYICTYDKMNPSFHKL